MQNIKAKPNSSSEPGRTEQEIKSGHRQMLGRPGIQRKIAYRAARTFGIERRGPACGHGSPNVNPGYDLVNNKNYPTIAEDYQKTFQTLKSLPVDLFLGAHGSCYGLEAKYDRLKSGDGNSFIDPDGYLKYVEERDRAFRTEWEKQREK
jgi:hypothetical protein